MIPRIELDFTDIKKICMIPRIELFLAAPNLSVTVTGVYEYMEHDLSGLCQNKDFHANKGTIKYFVKEILTGLRYIHDVANVVHRDVKCNTYQLSCFFS